MALAVAADGGKVGAYTEDGTVDLKGNPVQRSKRGGWRACSFVVVYEVFERMAFYGISSNLVLYLTNKLHQGTVASANNVTTWAGTVASANNVTTWAGTVWLTPILGAYIADAHLGRYWTFLGSCAVYISGMCLLTLAVSLPSLKPPPCEPWGCEKASNLQMAVFYGSLYILALGTGGTKPNISTIGADQFDDFDTREKQQKLSFFNWWMFGIFFGTLFANSVLVYIQDNVGWALGYALPTLGLAISIAIFIAGTPFYRHRPPAGSPFATMARVILAPLTNFKDAPSPHEVEQTKQMLRMIPILVATFIPSTMVAQISTLFVKQGTTLDRSIGSFKIPPASLAAFVTISMLISVVLYDRCLVKLLRKWTKNPRGITLLQRMGIGFLIHILLMVIASLTENYRLQIAKRSNFVNGGQIPLTVFILLPQFVLFGVADAFAGVAMLEFFYDQAPENMKSLGTSYATSSLGVGNFISNFLLKTMADVTSKRGKGWILDNLNASRLDLYYAFLALLTLLNFVFFVIVAKRYVYKPELSDSMQLCKFSGKSSNKQRNQNEDQG